MKYNYSIDTERRRLESKYRQINHMPSSEVNNDKEDFSYWSFLKLRIGFSILLLFFLLGNAKAFDSPESKKINNLLKQMERQDPYTKKVVDVFKNIKHTSQLVD